jgi:serine/threonine protein kinase
VPLTIRPELITPPWIRYNPPEVKYQVASPIDPVDLPKCDMWAYGLALWEIFLDGASFFRKSWLDDAACVKTWPESLQSNAGEMAEVGADTDFLSDVSPMETEESGRTLFGYFDPRRLSGLATEFISSIKFGGGFIDKAILRKFLNRSLQVDPKDRPSKITLGPLMSTWKYV